MTSELKKRNVIKNNSIKIFCPSKHLTDIESRHYHPISIDKCRHAAKLCHFNFK